MICLRLSLNLTYQRLVYSTHSTRLVSGNLVSCMSLRLRLASVFAHNGLNISLGIQCIKDIAGRVCRLFPVKVLDINRSSMVQMMAVHCVSDMVLVEIFISKCVYTLHQAKIKKTRINPESDDLRTLLYQLENMVVAEIKRRSDGSGLGPLLVTWIKFNFSMDK